MSEVNDVLVLRVDLDGFIFTLRAIDPFTLVILYAVYAMNSKGLVQP